MHSTDPNIACLGLRLSRTRADETVAAAAAADVALANAAAMQNPER